MSDNQPNNGSNTERGILTNEDEDFLNDRESYDPQQSYNKRENIKGRAAVAMRDFSLLVDELEEEELEEIFVEFEEYTGEDEPDVETAAADMVAFLYRGFSSISRDADNFIGDQDGITILPHVQQVLAFRRSLCAGIKKGVEFFGDAPDTVTIDVNTPLEEFPEEDDVREFIETKNIRFEEADRNSDSWLSVEGVEKKEDFYIDETIEAVISRAEYKIFDEVRKRRNEANEDLIRYRPWIFDYLPDFVNK